jgi:hypothetical protein
VSGVGVLLKHKVSGVGVLLKHKVSGVGVLLKHKVSGVGVLLKLASERARCGQRAEVERQSTENKVYFRN